MREVYTKPITDNYGEVSHRAAYKIAQGTRKAKKQREAKARLVYRKAVGLEEGKP